MVNGCSEFGNAKRVDMINVGIRNVEVEIVDQIITSGFSREHNRVDKLIESENGFFVFQFDIGEVEKRNRVPYITYVKPSNLDQATIYTV
ncbi:hypothetical protein MTR_2g006710 [Medicago truncatula]|uniref:Uncharacterized protein n=1 Tax=Medicago truncatula TaxID=3880 RepID=G7IPE7_MEDTR|nr:hypothetical protein MTR_2g006710 [Medicago truncatula]